MEILRKTEIHFLNKGTLQACGLYNVSNYNEDVSFWFDEETKDELINMSDDDFDAECERSIKESY